MDSEQPVLELACGTGRLLIEYLNAGIDIDGLDSSQPMLEKCKIKADELGLKTTLYHQNLESMELNRKYKTIFVAGGSFQLVDTFEKTMMALERIYNNLEPGGKLVLDLFIPWEQIMANQQGVWRQGRTADRDNVTFAAQHSDTLDLKNQVIKGKTKYELYEDTKLTETYFGTINLKWYSINEFKLMLEKTGFAAIKTEDKHLISTHGEATVYYAFKKS
ncbi:MAG: class I SAM-dependent methyltransferase [bacterium]|nr:class I SAM-dependent methyltransferase [bacterium]